MKLYEETKSNEPEVNRYDLVRFMKFRKTERFREIEEYLLPMHILEIMLALRFYARDTISIEQLWDNYKEEYSKCDEYGKWMQYLFRELTRYSSGAIRTLISDRVIDARELTEALILLDNENLDFNNPI